MKLPNGKATGRRPLPRRALRRRLPTFPISAARIRAAVRWMGIGYVADALAAVLGVVYRRYVQLANGILLRSGWWPTSLHLGLVSIFRVWGGVFLDYGGAAYHAKHPAFGAVGDNTNDDTAELQAWLNAVVSTSAVKKGFLNDGTYKTTAPVTIPDLAGNRKYHVIIEGAGAPDLCYDGNYDPTELGGSIISYTPTDGTHCLAFTPSGVTSGVVAITLRNVQIQHATQSASSGDGLRFVGDEANARQIRVNFENVAARGFKGGSGAHLQFCMNTGSSNLTCNRNKYGLTVTDASNANSFFNFVGQYNTTNAVRLLDVVSVHFHGGLIQHNLRNGMLIEGADEVGLNGVHFETNSTDAAGTYHALHIKGSSGFFNARIKIDSCRFASTAANDSIRIEGHASGSTSYVTFINSRSMVGSGSSCTIADTNCLYIMFLTPLGGTITDSGIGTVYFENGFIQLKELGADPAAPASNNLRLFGKDNGAGKTQLAARFPTGATQTPATEP